MTIVIAESRVLYFYFFILVYAPESYYALFGVYRLNNLGKVPQEWRNIDRGQMI